MNYGCIEADNETSFETLSFTVAEKCTEDVCSFGVNTINIFIKCYKNMDCFARVRSTI